jgi:hypothetical protein
MSEVPNMSVGRHPAPEAIVEEQLDERLVSIEKELEADVLTFIGQLIYGSDDLIRNRRREH